MNYGRTKKFAIDSVFIAMLNLKDKSLINLTSLYLFRFFFALSSPFVRPLFGSASGAPEREAKKTRTRSEQKVPIVPIMPLKEEQLPLITVLFMQNHL